MTTPPATAPPAGRAATGLAAAAFLIMAGNLLSRVLGLVREQLASGLFGAGDAIAAFTIADNLNTLVYDLLVYGMLQAAIVPVLARYAAPVHRETLRRLGGALVTIAALGLGAVVVVGWFAAPWLVRLMTALGGGDDARGADTTALTITLVRLVLPSLLFLGIGGVLTAMLYALDRVTAPALGAAARNACVVVAILVLSDRLGVRSMSVGIVAGAAAVALLQLPALARADAMPRLNLRLRDPDLRRILALYTPIAAGIAISAVAVVIDRNLAWGAEEDALGAMRYATTVVQLVMGLVGLAVSMAALPTLARHHDAGDAAAFRATLGRALGLVTALVFPAVLGIAAIAPALVDLLFAHGSTSDREARTITIALLAYLPGHLLAAYDQVLVFAFYARQNTRTPTLVTFLSVAVWLLLAFPLADRFGMLGLVLANSAQLGVHAGVMFWLARASFGLGDHAALRRGVVRCAAAALAMAVVALLARLGLDALLPTAGTTASDIARELAVVALPVGIGAIVYVTAALALRADDVLTLAAGVRARLARPATPR